MAARARSPRPALDVSLLLAVVIGLERLRVKSGSVIHDLGARLLAAVVFVMIVFSLGVSENPLFTGEPVGGPFINLVLLGYGLPAVLAGILALLTYGTRPYWYWATAAATALGLALAYLSLEIRTLYHGPVLTEGATSDAEQYTYSAVWLLFGVALLAAGILRRSLHLAHRLGRGRDADRAESVPHRHVRSDRHLPRSVLPRPRRGADRHRLVLSAPAVPPPT